VRARHTQRVVVLEWGCEGTELGPVRLRRVPGEHLGEVGCEGGEGRRFAESEEVDVE
jgi:hypothetical protein